MFLCDFIRDSLVICLSWILLAMSFYSWGHCFSDWLKIKILGERGHITNIWLGWCFCLFFFSIFHLVLPINAWGSFLFYFPGLMYFFIKFYNKINEYFKKIKKEKLLFLVVMGLLVSTFAVQMPYSHFDTGLYHLNTINWANEYPIIKGIGNLHTRLGFNQFFFLYVASLNIHPFFDDYGFHISNSFLFILFVLTCVYFNTFIDYILLCLFFFIPLNSLQSNVSMLCVATPDLAISILQIVVFRYSFEAFLIEKNDKETESFILCSVLFGVFMVTLKLSGVAFVFGVIAISLLNYRNRLLTLINKKTTKRCLVFVIILSLIYLIRGYIQTGYPFFPATFGSNLNFDWKVPLVNAEYIRNHVFAGSRSDGRILSIEHPMLKNMRWLDFWINWHVYRTKYITDFIANPLISLVFILFPMLLPTKATGALVLFFTSLAMLGVWSLLVCKHKELFYKGYFVFGWVVVLLASVGFWWVVAPEPRFSNSIFILLFVCSLFLLNLFFRLNMNNNIFMLLKAYSIIVFLLCLVQDFNLGIYTIAGVRSFEKVPLKKMISNHGVEVFIPIPSIKSWNSGLMCSPEFNTELGLRTGDIKDGFYIRNHETNKLILKPIQEWLNK